MSRLGKTAESLLSDVFIKLVISAAIGQRHLYESIFRLFKEIDADISKITMQRYELYFWHCQSVSPYVRRCHPNVTLCHPTCGRPLQMSKKMRNFAL